jgi:hypothetical protein
MAEGRPWLPESSDYWFFATFCGSTSFVALKDETPAGGLIACLNPEKPDEIYIDQVAVHRSGSRRPCSVPWSVGPGSSDAPASG